VLNLIFPSFFTTGFCFPPHRCFPSPVEVDSFFWQFCSSKPSSFLLLLFCHRCPSFPDSSSFVSLSTTDLPLPSRYFGRKKDSQFSQTRLFLSPFPYPPPPPPPLQQCFQGQILLLTLHIFTLSGLSIVSLFPLARGSARETTPFPPQVQYLPIFDTFLHSPSLRINIDILFRVNFPSFFFPTLMGQNRRVPFFRGSWIDGVLDLCAVSLFFSELSSMVLPPVFLLARFFLGSYFESDRWSKFKSLLFQSLFDVYYADLNTGHAFRLVTVHSVIRDVPTARPP